LDHEARAVARWSRCLLPIAIAVHGAIHCIRALRKGTGIVLVIGTGEAKWLIPRGTV
jgi:hypothetical protein